MDPRTDRGIAEREYIAAFDRLPPAPFGVADEIGEQTGEQSPKMSVPRGFVPRLLIST